MKFDPARTTRSSRILHVTGSGGRVLHCEECLSRHGRFVGVSPGSACRVCGHMPEVQLTPAEIRACMGQP